MIKIYTSSGMYPLFIGKKEFLRTDYITLQKELEKIDKYSSNTAVANENLENLVTAYISEDAQFLGILGIKMH